MLERIARGSRFASLIGAGLLAAGAAYAADPIKIGVLEDQSGDFAAATIGKVHAIQLAADEINKAGGIAGRQLELVIYDTQSDNTRYQEFMRRVLAARQGRRRVRRLLQRLARGLPADRRPARRLCLLQQPVRRRRLRRQHDRHRRGAGAAVLDAHPLDDGEVRQEGLHDRRRLQFRPDLGRMGAQDRQGERRQMVGEEFIPLGVSQFSQTIQNIQKAKPDVAGDAAGRHRAGLLLRAGGLRQPEDADGQLGQRRPGLRAQALQAAEPRQHVRHDELHRGGRHAREQGVRHQVARPSSRTSPTSTRKRRTPTTPIYLYKQMVERANGSTKRDDLRAVIAKGDVCIDAPAGKVCIDPKSQHTSHTIYLAQVGADHSITFPKVWNDIKPYWLGEAGCDLTKNDPSAQYTPEQPAAEALIAATSRARGDVRWRAQAGASRYPSATCCHRRRSSLRTEACEWTSLSSLFAFLYQFGDAFAFLVLAGVRARGHLRHDGRHQPGPWRVHHVRRLCHGLRRAGRAAAAARHPLRQPGRRSWSASSSSAWSSAISTTGRSIPSSPPGASA